MSHYELLRDKPNVGSVRWFIVRGGKMLSYDGQNENRDVRPPVYASCYSRKKDALEKIQNFKDWDIYLERLFSQDFSRVYIWTADEWKQIEKMAEKLRENELRWTSYGGKKTMREQSKEAHWINMMDLRKHRLDTTKNNAITRRVMAARYEAHELAGVEL